MNNFWTLTKMQLALNSESDQRCCAPGALRGRTLGSDSCSARDEEIGRVLTGVSPGDEAPQSRRPDAAV